MDDQLKLRTRLRTKATKLINDTKAYRGQDANEIDVDYLAYKIHSLEQLQKELQTVHVGLDKEAITDDTAHNDQLEEEIFIASRLLNRLERAMDARDKRQSSAPERDYIGSNDLRSSVAVKIPTFNGDIMKWTAFWELFSVTVHNNTHYANVEKLVLLKSHLTGAAEKAIEGIPVSGDSYTTAIHILKERFQKEDIVKETLMKQLLEAPAVSNGNDLRALRGLVDHMTAHTRALATLGVSPDSFSSLLLPMMKAKIPESWRLDWARQGKSTYEQFLQHLQTEVTLRESVRSASSLTTRTSTPPPSVTTAFHVQPGNQRIDTRLLLAQQPQEPADCHDYTAATQNGRTTEQPEHYSFHSLRVDLAQDHFSPLKTQQGIKSITYASNLPPVHGGEGHNGTTSLNDAPPVPDGEGHTESRCRPIDVPHRRAPPHPRPTNPHPAAVPDPDGQLLLLPATENDAPSFCEDRDLGLATTPLEPPHPLLPEPEEDSRGEPVLTKPPVTHAETMHTFDHCTNHNSRFPARLSSSMCLRCKETLPCPESDSRVSPTEMSCVMVGDGLTGDAELHVAHGVRTSSASRSARHPCGIPATRLPLGTPPLGGRGRPPETAPAQDGAAAEARPGRLPGQRRGCLWLGRGPVRWPNSRPPECRLFGIQVQ